MPQHRQAVGLGGLPPAETLQAWPGFGREALASRAERDQAGAISIEGVAMPRSRTHSKSSKRQHRTRRRKRPELSPSRVEEFVGSVFDDLHAARVLSLANGTTGVLEAGALGVHAIGRGLAAAKGLDDKHAVKQVDRLLSNEGVDVSALFEQWVPLVVGPRREVFANLDWTEFDADDHSMLVLGMQTKHGRSTPLVWSTVVKSRLAGQRNAHEDRLLARFAEVVPKGVKVTVVADRGFSDQKLYRFLKQDLGFEFIIRFRSVVQVTSEDGETRKARDWLGKGGRMRVLRNATVTSKRCPVAMVVVVQDKGMKDAWCLAVSDATLTGQQAKRRYGKRFSCEETFRDIKDLHYGMGMSWYGISQTARRDRMFLLAAMAHGLLTLLGEAGERLGLDRLLKANTAKRRSLSLFRQGLRWYQLIPRMPEARLRLLMEAFEAALAEVEFYQAVFRYL